MNCKHCDLTSIPTKVLIGELVRREGNCFSWDVKAGGHYAITIDDDEDFDGFGFIHEGPSTIIAIYDYGDEEGEIQIEPPKEGGGTDD